MGNEHERPQKRKKRKAKLSRTASGCQTVSGDSGSTQSQFSKKSVSQSDVLAVQPWLQVGQNMQTVI